MGHDALYEYTGEESGFSVFSVLQRTPRPAPTPSGKTRATEFSHPISHRTPHYRCEMPELGGR